MEKFSSASDAFFACAQASEVFGSAGNNVDSEFDFDASFGRSADCYIEEYDGVISACHVMFFVCGDGV